jgi:hypothetical protein
MGQWCASHLYMLWLRGLLVVGSDSHWMGSGQSVKTSVLWSAEVAWRQWGCSRYVGPSNAGISNLVYTVLYLRRLVSSAEVLWDPQVFWISGSWFSHAVWWQDKPPRTLWVFGSKFVGNECKVARSSVQPNMKTKLTSQSDDLCYCVTADAGTVVSVSGDKWTKLEH